MATRFYRSGSGVATDVVTDIKVMASFTTGNNNYMTLEFPVGTDYQVTAGKTLYITKLFITTDTTGSGIEIGYGDTGVADGVAAPTNYVKVAEQHRVFANTTTTYDVWIPIPATKYPTVRESPAAGGNVYVTINGFEI